MIRIAPSITLAPPWFVCSTHCCKNECLAVELIALMSLDRRALALEGFAATKMDCLQPPIGPPYSTRCNARSNWKVETVTSRYSKVLQCVCPTARWCLQTAPTAACTNGPDFILDVGPCICLTAMHTNGSKLQRGCGSLAMCRQRSLRWMQHSSSRPASGQPCCKRSGWSCWQRRRLCASACHLALS